MFFNIEYSNGRTILKQMFIALNNMASKEILDDLKVENGMAFANLYMRYLA